MKKDERLFFSILISFIVILFFLSVFILYFVFYKDVNYLKMFLKIFCIAVIFISIIILWSCIILLKTVTGKKIFNLENKLIKMVLKIMYPFIIAVSNMFKKDTNGIRRVFARINNILVKTKNIKVREDEILILLPHCLQNSECKVKITNDINNCVRCKRCDISSIIELCDKHRVKAIVATGGTLARQWIKKIKPKAIIAVACERDLVSGINDVQVIPVLGVTNKRPNGPCFDTKVDIEKIEDAIKYFLKEE